VVHTETVVWVFGRRRRLSLVPLMTALALAAAAPAGAAVSTVNRLISQQYQGNSGDTATATRVAVIAGRPARRAGPHGSPTTWYQTRNSRYQLPDRLFPRSAESSEYIANPERAISASVPRNNRLQIARQISTRGAITREPRAISSGDARLLLQLGLGLGLAYVVFLAAWFWRTRNRTEGAAARVVRF
jgi:hypothetical protein